MLYVPSGLPQGLRARATDPGAGGRPDAYSKRALGRGTRVYNDVAAALMSLDLANTGWAKKLPDVAERHARRWVVSDFIIPLLTLTFNIQRLSPEDEKALEVTFDTFYRRRLKFENKAHMNSWVAKKLAEMRKQRLMAQRSRLEEGEKAIETIRVDEDQEQ